MVRFARQGDEFSRQQEARQVNCCTWMRRADQSCEERDVHESHCYCCG